MPRRDAEEVSEPGRFVHLLSLEEAGAAFCPAQPGKGAVTARLERVTCPACLEEASRLLANERNRRSFIRLRRGA